MLRSASPRTRQLCSELLHRSEREAADVHGIARGTVRKHMRRLRERFDA
jgi:DNA-binding CsgD family transcriptional regulator